MDPEMKAMFQAIMNKLEEHDRKFDEMNEKISASEERTKREIMAFIENGVQRDVRILAEGHSMLSDKIDRVSAEVAELREGLENLEVVTRVNASPIRRVK